MDHHHGVLGAALRFAHVVIHHLFQSLGEKLVAHVLGVQDDAAYKLLAINLVLSGEEKCRLINMFVAASRVLRFNVVSRTLVRHLAHLVVEALKFYAQPAFVHF